MKKFFMLAATAILFAACSSETTEDLIGGANFTRATGRENGCSLRGSDCKFFQDGKTGTHYHCDNKDCEYYYGYVTDLNSAEAKAHDASANAYHDRTSSHHGGYITVD